MLALAGATVTVTGEVIATALRQAFVPAVEGAADVALAELTTTSAVSMRPASSVTVSRTVNEPEDGATTVAVLVFAPEILGGVDPPPTLDQAYVSTAWLQAAALPAARSTTLLPAATLAGSATAAMGRNAAASAPGALAIPAPQVVVVQMHSA